MSREKITYFLRFDHQIFGRQIIFVIKYLMNKQKKRPTLEDWPLNNS
jgi:hypothetical protein